MLIQTNKVLREWTEHKKDEEDERSEGRGTNSEQQGEQFAATANTMFPARLWAM